MARRDNSNLTHTKTVAYLRVSTDKQADRGVSLEAQRAKVNQYAELYDLELIEVIVDAGESASSLNRPGLQRALKMLRDGTASALLIVKLDRLTRSVRDLCDLVEDYFRDGKCALLSVGEQVDTRSAAGRMMLNLLTVIGQWEREAIGERTVAAMQHLKDQGKFTGGPHVPYGYELADDGETLRVNHAEQQVIAEAKKLRGQRTERRMSLRGVAATLADRGMRSRKGRKFDPKQIDRMT